MSWITDIIEGIGKLITGSRDPKPIAFNRAHVWRFFKLRDPGETVLPLIKLDPPQCEYCHQERNKRTEFAPCPGPEIER